MKKLTIVTVCYNSETTIERTIVSVNKLLERDKTKSVDHLIVDGNSKDRTLCIIEKHKHTRRIVVTEADRGIYDAMNKGLNIATGNYIWYLNSDDYIDEDFIKSIDDFMEKIDLDQPDCVIGKIRMFKYSAGRMKISRSWGLPDVRGGKLPFGWHPPHPAFVARRDLLLELGGFDLEKKIAADFKLMMGVIRKNKKTLFYNTNMVLMQCGGESNGSMKNILIANIECFRSLKDIGYSGLYSSFFVIRKILNKILQLTGVII